MDTILRAPMNAEPLGIFDCCGVSDGSACTIVTTAEIVRALSRRELVMVKALQLSASCGRESGIDSWDGSYVINTQLAAKAAYKEECGIADPRKELSLLEVHDCFSITELVTMEDLGVSAPGEAWRDVLDGAFDADGRMPCQVNGSLKCFGHPVGASGLRRVYEHYLQLLGRAGERQLRNPVPGLSHKPWAVCPTIASGVAAISIVGLH